MGWVVSVENPEYRFSMKAFTSKTHSCNVLTAKNANEPRERARCIESAFLLPFLPAQQPPVQSGSVKEWSLAVHLSSFEHVFLTMTHSYSRTSPDCLSLSVPCGR
uniref:Uncharacterized protein n=1 Tax=Panagrellus redivivus TaxID=6233 RepID=A0A7E4VYJ8_PANRE